MIRAIISGALFFAIACLWAVAAAAIFSGFVTGFFGAGLGCGPGDALCEGSGDGEGAWLAAGCGGCVASGAMPE